MCHPPSRLICEAFSSESCQHPAPSSQHPASSIQHPASNTQHCAVILILEAISYLTLPSPHHVLSALSLQRTTIADHAARKAAGQAPPKHHLVFSTAAVPASGLMKPFPPTHRTIVTFPCGLENSRMDMRGGPTISRVLSKLRTVSLVSKY
jgi:hypothetical protein